MRTLILLRHAKSSWDHPELADHDRPLNKRGRRSAPAIAAWLAERGHQPDTVLCSSARRAQETAERVRKAFPELPEPEVERGLYHATPAVLSARLARLDDACRSAMVIGHEPGLGAFAHTLTNGRAEPGCARAFEHFPTAAAAIIALEIESWAALDRGIGTLVDFAVPRELTAN
ncbi:MAG TPA: histidine phosphatase family protein [Thermohalobaculum sp.]|nr:histidine phosphatase family protein [Thermohalobaculum sp.]